MKLEKVYIAALETTAQAVRFRAEKGNISVMKLRTDDGAYTVRADGKRVDVHRPYRPGQKPPKYRTLEDIPDTAEVVEVSRIYRKERAE